jgi:glutaminyl-peptide cyclotransferase
MSSVIYKRISIAAAAVCFLVAISGCTGKADNPKFSGETAYKLLKKQCDFGPRPLGTPAHEATADFLLAQTKKYADMALEQKFVYDSPSRHREYNGRNIIGVFGKNRKRWIILLSHYDTRPTADEEVNAAKARQPIIGADDGASGCAVMIELARMFHEKPPQVGVVMMFVDGEDFGPSPDEMFLGAKEFAQNWRQALKPVNGLSKIEFGILLDMIGDKDLQIHKEGFSVQRAPKIVDKVWSAASELGYGKYFESGEPGIRDTIMDDHQALLAVDIPCIDVIDFNYAYWHTLEDTPDKCSAESLQVVGDVMAKVVYAEQGK